MFMIEISTVFKWFVSTVWCGSGQYGYIGGGRENE
jgi:hypothetical protein